MTSARTKAKTAQRDSARRASTPTSGTNGSTTDAQPSDDAPPRDLLAPLREVRFVPHDDLRANDYNPNKVDEENLRLLQQSILSNGWTMPIVVRPDLTIIDGFHRWTVSGRDPLRSMLDGQVPIVVVSHEERSGDIYGTITHNRARGVHLLEPMRRIVQELLDSGADVPTIERETGMKAEEIFRLGNFTRDQFLDLMIGEQQGYSRAVHQVRTRL